MIRHVEVALPLPLFQTFTYRLDGPLPAEGTRVLVPFRRSERIGWVVGEADPEGISGIRPVRDVLERVPSLPPDLLELARWIADYYVAPLGIVLRSILPSVLSDGSREVVRALPAPEGPGGSESLPAGARRILEILDARGGAAPVASLRRAFGAGSVWPSLRRLSVEGRIEHETVPPPDPPVRRRKVVRLLRWIPDLARRETLFGRAERQRACFERLEAAGGAIDLATLLEAGSFSRSVVSGLEARGLVTIEEEEALRDPFGGAARPTAPEHSPTPDQGRAIEALTRGDGGGAPFLLHGVTGSGKTLVYAKVLEEVVGCAGRSAIVLVPEISLTPQTVSRFRGWFGDQVAVLHSGLSAGERYDQWRQIRRGDKRIVVGARSALFAPVPDLGAVIVDEEHDGSYKQSEAPRYHARDVAVVRARRTGGLCLLGSATPSLESWKNVAAGKFRLVRLPQRVHGRPLPPVEVVDLRKVRAARPGGTAGEARGPASGPVGATGRLSRGRPGEEASGGAGEGAPADREGLLSPRLVSAIRERLERGEQALLLLNRRGYASFVQCRACGSVQECPNCSVSLTLHRARKILLCHHCRHEEAAPERCRACGSRDLALQGTGTERVERAVVETFPDARIARMDVDTTGGKGSHHEILGRVERGEVDLLLGTQMIAKGLDFPRVTLVGVVNADVGIHLPDFRASERAFQLLSQVAGRAGRGELGGEVVIQSSLPEHYAIQAALRHDVEGFVRQEMEARKSPPYPPHLRLVNVGVSSPDRALVATAAEAAADWMRERLGGPGRGVPELVGPAPAPIERLHGRWRWHFFLRGGPVPTVTRLLRELLEGFQPPAGDVRVIVDRDPVSLL